MILSARGLGIAIGLVAALTAWQAADRAPPSKVLVRETKTPSVRPGDNLLIHIVQKQNFEAEITYFRTLYDGANIRHTYGSETLTPRQLEPDFTLPLFVPPNAIAGQARLATVTCWERPYNLVHKIWPVCATMRPLTFTIAAN